MIQITGCVWPPIFLVSGNKIGGEVQKKSENCREKVGKKVRKKVRKIVGKNVGKTVEKKMIKKSGKRKSNTLLSKSNALLVWH